MIFGINTTHDISKLSQISLALRLVKLRITILKYHLWYLCQISLLIILLPILITDQLCLGPHKAQCLPCLEIIFTLEHFSWLALFHSHLKLGCLWNLFTAFTKPFWNIVICNVSHCFIREVKHHIYMCNGKHEFVPRELSFTVHYFNA